MILDSSVMMSSVMPSRKCSSFFTPLGSRRTAGDRSLGRRIGAVASAIVFLPGRCRAEARSNRSSDRLRSGNEVQVFLERLLRIRPNSAGSSALACVTGTG